jgi:hypothetical protein
MRDVATPSSLGALILPQGKNLDHTSLWLCCVVGKVLLGKINNLNDWFD